MPLKLQGCLPDPICILAQNSKKGLIPKNYIALVGDSYSVGLGDHYLNIRNQFRNRSDFGSHGILYKKTGNDIITLGQGGAGSLDGLVAKPINRFRYLNATFFCKVDEPKLILVYFYENDIDNNIQDLKAHFINRYDLKKIYDKTYFKRFIDEEIMSKDSIYKKTESFHWYDNLFFLRFVTNLTLKVNSRLKKILNYEKIENTIEPLEKSINQVLINDKVVIIPRTQGPALELTEEEINLAACVFEHSLDYLSEYFINSKIIVVYIPTPLSVYELASQKVNIWEYHDRGKVQNSENVAKKSDLICGKIKKITLSKKYIFIDTRNKLRQAAQKEPIHGPLDWIHFNKVGYAVFSETIAPYIKNEM